MRSEVGPLLVVLAHPDDEFAIFPWLRRAAAAGRKLELVWLTDGGWGGQDIVRRRRESVGVLTRLGVAKDSLYFWGVERRIPDGSLHRRLVEVVPELLEQFGVADVGGDVLMPAWEGGHQDHDASHIAGIKLAQARRSHMWQYPLYNGQGLRGPLFKVLSPLTENGRAEVVGTEFPERLRYAAMCLSYRSQWKSFLGLLPLYLARMCRGDAFVVQSVEPARIHQRPHEGALLYERRSLVTWGDFAAATEALRGR